MKTKSKDHIGTLGEPEAKRLVADFYEDCRLRNRVAVLCGVMIGALMVWSELVLFQMMGG